MSLFRRFIGRRSDDPYAKGVALYEQSRFAEAIEFLRHAAQQQRESPAGSLATFHLRQALVGEGRRLLRSGKPADALPCLQEAATAWDTFPDLQFLLGAARGLAGDWDRALRSAQAALRLNPDYCEARLLEANALIHMDRAREAAASLNKLLEAGRRSNSPLAHTLARKDGYTVATLPLDLAARLEKAAGGEWQDGAVIAATALCRSGHWEQGLARLRELVQTHPSYPDYRIKLAAALFQLDRAQEALPEVEEALRLNPLYRTAMYLKALILADQQRYEAAREVLISAADNPGARSSRGHEEMFAAYLGSTCALLTGRLDEAELTLQGWGDLTRSFPRAALLRAAVADLKGRPTIASEQMMALVDVWPVEADYLHLLACHRLRERDWGEVEKLLSRWPKAETQQLDERPLRLAVLVALNRGEAPDLPPLEPNTCQTADWRYLRAWTLANREEWGNCWQEVLSLWEQGRSTEPVALLMSTAALQLAGTKAVSESWQPPAVVSGDVLVRGIYLSNRRDRREETDRLRVLHRQVHPEDLRWTWLDPESWLGPIRRWIG